MHRKIDWTSHPGTQAPFSSSTGCRWQSCLSEDPQEMETSESSSQQELKAALKQIKDLEELHEQEMITLQDELNKLKETCATEIEINKDNKDRITTLEKDLATEKDEVSKMRKNINDLETTREIRIPSSRTVMVHAFVRKGLTESLWDPASWHSMIACTDENKVGAFLEDVAAFLNFITRHLKRWLESAKQDQLLDLKALDLEAINRRLTGPIAESASQNWGRLDCCYVCTFSSDRTTLLQGYFASYSTLSEMETFT